MRALAELAPWETFALGACPWPGFWAFNPSIACVPTPAGESDRWLCVVRCANYHLPGSVAANTSSGPIRNRNLMLELDPATWRVMDAIEIFDLDAAERGAFRYMPSFGYEDMRLVWSSDPREPLVGLASTIMLNDRGTIEIARLELDNHYQIVSVDPLRGMAWEGRHQKNWAPFQGSPRTRMLFSVTEGGIHDRNGRIVPTHPAAIILDEPTPTVTRGGRAVLPARRPPSNYKHGAIEVQIGPGSHKTAAPRQAKFTLRGGSQLLQVSAGGEWLGLAHGCEVGDTKRYWHRFYLIDGHDGALRALSEPFKLCPEVGIEFVAGMALDKATDRLVISFGVEDDSAHLGVTTLASALETLRAL